MKAFLGFISGLLTVGVSLIAYGVLNPRASAMNGPFSATGAAGADFQTSRPMFASERVDYPYSDRLVPVARQEVAYQPAIQRTPVVYRTSAPRPATSSRIERSSGRDWLKTAMVIGGTTAAGAGVGGIFGGKKGALIGAAIGGGASSIYEARK